MALLALEAQGANVAALVTTLGEGFRRISMHGVREALLEAQAAALGLELIKVWLPQACDNRTYRARMADAARPLRGTGVTAFAFGDLFLADVRAFREEQMRALDLVALFPVWGVATPDLAHRFLDSGHRAVLTCVDAEQLSPDFLGRDYDAALLSTLPDTADPCGENGEFHTFVYAGPRFAGPIAFRRGRRTQRDGRFHMLDLAPEPETDRPV